MAIAGSIAAGMTLMIPLYLGLGIRQSIAGAADAAALAGADVAAGIAPGSPCQVAASIARANHASLDACIADGLVVSVRASTGFLGLTLSASASAGPPVAGSD